MDNSNQVKLLNDLLQRCYESEEGYKDAAKQINNGTLTELFQKYSQQRYDFGHQLKDQIKALDGNVDKGGSILATAHRAWLDLRSFIAGNRDTFAILEEVERGELTALETYKKAISSGDLEGDAAQVVKDQREAIEKSIQEVQSLKNSAV